MRLPVVLLRGARSGVGASAPSSCARWRGDLLSRGYRAVEAIGDRAWDGSWVLPVPFLVANGFTVLKEDARYPLLRLDLRAVHEPAAAHEAAEVALPTVQLEV